LTMSDASAGGLTGSEGDGLHEAAMSPTRINKTMNFCFI
jgi:hypothetical protein